MLAIFARSGDANWTITERKVGGGAMPGTPTYDLVRAVHSSGRATIYYVGLHNYDFSNLSDVAVPEDLWLRSGATAQSQLTDGRNALQTYTRETLIDLLHGLMIKHIPTTITTSDSSGFWPPVPPFDNSDHMYGAMFGLSAAQRYSGNHLFRTYRGYNAAFFEPPNVAVEDAIGDSNGNGLDGRIPWKPEVLTYYMPYDVKVCNSPAHNVLICNRSIGCDPVGQAAQTDFSEANNWNNAAFGSTIQLGNINADPRADVCGRRADGIYCADRAAGWGVLTKRTSLFGAGWEAPAQYRSIRLVDVTGDGRADLCGRDTSGIIQCSVNTGTGTVFGELKAWTSTSAAYFSSAEGWNAVASASTLSFADVDGDGQADVCARGAEGAVLHAPQRQDFQRSDRRTRKRRLRALPPLELHRTVHRLGRLEWAPLLLPDGRLGRCHGRRQSRGLRTRT